MSADVQGAIQDLWEARTIELFDARVRWLKTHDPALLPQGLETLRLRVVARQIRDLKVRSAQVPASRGHLRGLIHRLVNERRRMEDLRAAQPLAAKNLRRPT